MRDRVKKLTLTFVGTFAVMALAISVAAAIAQLFMSGHYFNAAIIFCIAVAIEITALTWFA